jgi:hypothetical protein
VKLTRSTSPKKKVADPKVGVSTQVRPPVQKSGDSLQVAKSTTAAPASTSQERPTTSDDHVRFSCTISFLRFVFMSSGLLVGGASSASGGSSPRGYVRLSVVEHRLNYL